MKRPRYPLGPALLSPYLWWGQPPGVWTKHCHTQVHLSRCRKHRLSRDTQVHSPVAPCHLTDWVTTLHILPGSRGHTQVSSPEPWTVCSPGGLSRQQDHPHFAHQNKHSCAQWSTSLCGPGEEPCKPLPLGVLGILPASCFMFPGLSSLLCKKLPSPKRSLQGRKEAALRVCTLFNLKSFQRVFFKKSNNFTARAKALARKQDHLPWVPDEEEDDLLTFG